METPICPVCEYSPDVDNVFWVELLIQHIINIHGWTIKDAENYVHGRPYKG